MDKASHGWLVSLLSGFSFGNSLFVTCFRMSILLVLVTFQFFINHQKMSVYKYLYYSFFLSMVIFLIKFIIYALNILIDHSYQISDSNSEESLTEIDVDKLPPEGVPRDLWLLRNNYTYSTIRTEEEYIELSSHGFDPEAIDIFFRAINDINEKNSITTKKRVDFILIFGIKIIIPISRLTINSIFPDNHSFSYIILVFILTFSQSFLLSLMIKQFTLYEKLWLCYISGAATYSSLHPPEADPYSTTRGDKYNGIVRSISLTTLSASWHLFNFLKDSFSTPIEIPELHLAITIQKFADLMCYTLRFILVFFPISIFFFIGHPSTMLLWITESIGKYFFGLAGASGMRGSLSQLARSFLVTILLGFFLIFDPLQHSIAYGIGASMLILQFPIIRQRIIYRKILGIFLTLIVSSFCAFLSSYFSMKYLPFIGNNIMYLSITICFSFDVIWPYISSNSKYLIVYHQFVKSSSNTVDSIRYLTPYFFMPLVMGYILVSDPVNQFVTAFIIVVVINISLLEPHLFSISLILSHFMLEIEFCLPHPSINLLLGVILSKKIISVLSIIDFWQRGRISILQFVSDSYSINDNNTNIFAFIVKVFLSLFPGPDRVITMPGLVWSLLTSSPFYSPQSLSVILLPFSPKPNVFWDYSIEDELKIENIFLKGSANYPIETPVYASLSSSLIASLATLVYSGKLGIVNNNDVFLFISQPLTAFIHIIALEPFCLKFQLRGLEYNDETLCHLGEIATIQNDIESYSNDLPNFLSPMLYIGTSWTLLSRNLPLYQYDVSAFSSTTLFLNLHKLEIEQYILFSFVRIMAQYSDIIENENYNEEFNEFEALEDLVIDQSPGCSVQFIRNSKFLYSYFNSLIISNDGLQMNNCYDLFHGSYEKLVLPYLHNDELKQIFSKASRLFLLSISLVSLGFGPERMSEISEFFDIISLQYLSEPIRNEGFSREFIAMKKDLMSIEEKRGEKTILFFRRSKVFWNILRIQKSCCRTFWASEACQQIFFGEDDDERMSIQEDGYFLHNLLLQACDLPIGYPAFVSPVLTSYSSPLTLDFLD